MLRQESLLSAEVQIQLHIVRRPAAGGDVGPAVAVEVVDDEVFGGDAAVVDDVLLRLASRFDGVDVIDEDARTGDGAGSLVAVSEDDLIRAVAVDVSRA